MVYNLPNNGNDTYKWYMCPSFWGGVSKFETNKNGVSYDLIAVCALRFHGPLDTVFVNVHYYFDIQLLY